MDKLMKIMTARERERERDRQTDSLTQEVEPHAGALYLSMPK